MKILNWRVIIISLTLAGCAYASHLGQVNQMKLAEDTKVVEFPKAKVVEVQVVTKEQPVAHNPSKKEIAQLILQNFPKNGEVMVAIALAESNLQVNAQGFNCFYKKGVLYKERVKGAVSRHCDKGDEVYAWSTDCFPLQRNYVGTTKCPDVPIEQHIKEVAELSRVCDLNCWSAYNNGSWKSKLSEAKQLITQKKEKRL